MRFSKLAQNSPENDIYVKQESVPPFLGIVGDKSGLRFWIWASEVPFFCTRKTAIFSNFAMGVLDSYIKALGGVKNHYK